MIADVAVQLGEPDYFALMVVAFITVGALIGSSVPRGLASLALGLFLGLVGTDTLTGQQRFTFGVPNLADGIDVVVVAVGLFAVGEIAWAVYHYGRWAFEPQMGWYWVPGRVWAPAWVSWRRSNDYVGWAPLPPEGDGLSISVSISTYEPPRSHWHFVPVRKFASRDLSVVVVNDNSVYEHTEYYGPVTIENNIVINNVININFVRENSDEEVEVVEAKVVNDPRDAKRRMVAPWSRLRGRSASHPRLRLRRRAKSRRR